MFGLNFDFDYLYNILSLLLGNTLKIPTYTRTKI